MSGAVILQGPERMSDFSKITQLVRQTQGEKERTWALSLTAGQTLVKHLPFLSLFPHLYKVCVRKWGGVRGCLEGPCGS